MSKSTNTEHPMTTTQAARQKGVTRQCIAQAIWRGDLKARKTHTQRGPVWMIDPASLAAWTPGHPRKPSGRAGIRTQGGA